MCKPGNGTIRWECRDIIRKMTGHYAMSNRDMRMLLAENGGCMVGGRHTKVDKAESTILKS